MSKTSIQIFEFLDYRSYLREKFAALKKARWYSERAFAVRAGFGSPSFMKMILDGKRNLSLKSAKKIAGALGLNQGESKFFEALVVFNQASSDEEKDLAFQKILHFKKYHRVKRIEATHYQYLSKWYHVAIREALGTERWKSASVSELADVLGIAEEEVGESISLLLSLGMIEKDSLGQYTVLSPAIQTSREVQSLTVRNFHREMIEKAKEALSSVEPSAREVGALTIALSPEKFIEVKERISQFRRDLNALFSEDSKASQVYQLNFQFFPLFTRFDSAHDKKDRP